MTALLAAAVADNVRWCHTVCRSHDLSARIESGVWSTDSKAPPFYPDAITIDPAATSSQVDNVLAGRRPASVNDSYACLDLSRHGFEPLFSATWIAADATVDHASAPATWEHVQTATVLAEWSTAHGAVGVFHPSLLVDPAVVFLALREAGHIVAGAIATRSAATIGLSNVFSSVSADDLWDRIVAELGARFPGVPIVGYERDGDLVKARAAGFSALGPLRVWVRPEH